MIMLVKARKVRDSDNVYVILPRVINYSEFLSKFHDNNFASTILKNRLRRRCEKFRPTKIEKLPHYTIPLPHRFYTFIMAFQKYRCYMAVMRSKGLRNEQTLQILVRHSIIVYHF